jgi:ribosomal protein L44E
MFRCCIHLDGIDSNCLQHSVGSHFCTHSAKLLDASYYKQSILVYIYTFNRNIDQRRGIRQGNACATDLYTPPGKLQLECSCCKKPHKLENCTAISRLEHQERLSHLKSLALCFRCLKRGHMSKKCKYRLICSACNKRHPTILHYEYKNENQNCSTVF